jgi:hypothetical protein
LVCVQVGPWLLLFSETLDGGELMDHIAHHGLFSEASVRVMSAQILMSVQYMHALGIAHRDLKPQNVLCAEAPEQCSPADLVQQLQATGVATPAMSGGEARPPPLAIGAPESYAKRFSLGSPARKGGDGKAADGGGRAGRAKGKASSRTWHLKICDFGHAKQLPGAESVMSTPCGSVPFAAPEVYRSAYSLPADIWSVGCIIRLLLTGLLPHGGRCGPETPPTPEAGEEMVWDGVSPLARHLVQSMLSRDPAIRPTATRALLHPWFAETFAVGSGASGPGPTAMSTGDADSDSGSLPPSTRRAAPTECGNAGGNAGGGSSSENGGGRAALVARHERMAVPQPCSPVGNAWEAFRPPEESEASRSIAAWREVLPSLDEKACKPLQAFAFSPDLRSAAAEARRARGRWVGMGAAAAAAAAAFTAATLAAKAADARHMEPCHAPLAVVEQPPAAAPSPDDTVAPQSFALPRAADLTFGSDDALGRRCPKRCQPPSYEASPKEVGVPAAPCANRVQGTGAAAALPHAGGALSDDGGWGSTPSTERDDCSPSDGSFSTRSFLIGAPPLPSSHRDFKRRRGGAWTCCASGQDSSAPQAGPPTHLGPRAARAHVGAGSSFAPRPRNAGGEGGSCAEPAPMWQQRRS